MSVNLNGGSAMSQLYEATGTTIDQSKYTPTRNSCEFAGWYFDAALTKKITSVSLTENDTIYAKWTKQEEQTEPEKQVTNPFTDVPNGQYYHDAVLWAVDEGIASGTSENTFCPDTVCPRAQAITFLWRAVGSPEPTLTSCPFIDVDKDEYYYKAVLWGMETGITNGITPTVFGANTTVTRSQATTFLWHAVGSPGASSQNPFGDITTGAYDYDAVLWAVEQDITHGTSEDSFSPHGLCTRGQLLTFLFRYINK
ncbi:MAG: S-layer homology domain-containing protein [Anaerotignum sp.]|nr:S-layer homology domain-containing protein [Anaerotignum sp.]